MKKIELDDLKEEVKDGLYDVYTSIRQGVQGIKEEVEDKKNLPTFTKEEPTSCQCSGRCSRCQTRQRIKWQAKGY